MSSTAIAQPAEAPKYAVSDYPFSLISTRKVIIMSVFTLNLYNIYWSHKAWQAINKTEGTSYRTIWRSIFGLFFIYSLAKRTGADPGKVLGSFIGAAMIGQFAPDPWSILSILAFMPILWMQKSINAEHTAEKINNTYSTKEKVFATIGGLLLALYILLLISPQQ